MINPIAAIKAFFAVNTAVNNLREAHMRSGFLTSEFWMAFLSQAVPVILAIWGFIPTSVMIQIMAAGGAVSAVYIISRTIIKATPSKADDAMFNRIVTIIKPLADKIGVPVTPIAPDEK